MGKIISFEVLSTIPVDGNGPGSNSRVQSGDAKKYEIERVSGASVRIRPIGTNNGRPRNWTVVPWSNFLVITEEPDEPVKAK